MISLWFKMAPAAAIFAALLVRYSVETRHDWTWPKLMQELAILDYKWTWVTSNNFPDSTTQGLYLARYDDPRSWEEIATHRPKLRPETLWRGLVVVCRNSYGSFRDRRPEELHVGSYVFFGDPLEIERLAAHFRLH
jgi:hypothetical protein